MTRSGEKFLWTPRPWHEGHAPSGLLNENTRGLISGRNAPCSGQANSSEYAIDSSCAVWNLCSPGSSDFLGLGALRLSIATAPAPSLRPASTPSVRRCRLALSSFIRSILTSMSCRRFFSSSGGFSKLASRPFTLPSRYPCSTRALNRSAWVPLRFRTTGLQTATAWPSNRQSTSSTISCTVRLATSLPQSGQCGRPTLAQSRRM